MMFAVGCAKENNADVVENNNDELVSYSFTVASLEEDAVRSDLTNAGAFSWEVGDYIAIYNSASSEYVSFEVTEVLSNGDAIISALATSGAVWTNAIYPAERAAGAGNQVDYTVSSVAGPILVSNVDSQELSFMYLGSVANIEVTGVPGTPITLTFTANANVFGTRSFSWDEYGKPVLGGSGSVDSITVPFNSAGVTTVPIPKADYAGFTITVDNAAGRHLYKKTTTKNFTLATSNAILLPMSAIAYSDPEFFIKFSSDANNYPLVQTQTNEYYVSLNAKLADTYSIFDEYNVGNPLGYDIKDAKVLPDGTISTTMFLKGGFNSWAGTAMKEIYSDYYCLKQELTATSYYKFFSNDVWYGYADDYKYSTDDGSSDFSASAGTYYFIIRTDVEKAMCVPVSSANHMDIEFNRSSNTARALPDWGASIEKPWNWVELGDMKIFGETDEDTWADLATLTYIGNMTWKYENFKPSYYCGENWTQFKFHIGGAYWGKNDNANLYNYAKRSEGNIWVPLVEGASYDVYVNAYGTKGTGEWEELRFSFVKR